MGLKLGYYWNHGSPFLFVCCRDMAKALALQATFSEVYGCPAGSLTKSAVLRFSGHAATEFLRFHNLPLVTYEGWTPKNDSRKYHRLPDSAFIDEARKHATRNNWKTGANGHYQHVWRRRQHLLPACIAHMVSEGDPFGKGYQVYAYEFSDNSVYVGLTCTPKRRHRVHLKRGPVARKIAAGTPYLFKEHATGLMPTQAGAAESGQMARYAAGGWQVLNTRGGGSTGQIRTKYAYSKLLELAQPYRARKEFNVGCPGAYQYACIHKLIDKIAAELGWPAHSGHKWTFAACLAEAAKFKWTSEWAVAPGGSYNAAQRYGWIPVIKQKLFTKKPGMVSKWTRDACAQRAKAFKSRTAWQYGCRDGSYVTARRKGWLNEIADPVFGARLHRWPSVGNAKVIL